jgi:hypothetical protein
MNKINVLYQNADDLLHNVVVRFYVSKQKCNFSIINKALPALLALPAACYTCSCLSCRILGEYVANSYDNEGRDSRVTDIKAYESTVCFLAHVTGCRHIWLYCPPPDIDST